MSVKFKVHILVTSLALSALLSTASYGQAAPAAASAPAKVPASAGPAPTKIGLVNVLEAIQTTNEGQKELDDLVKRFTPKQTELKNLSDEIDRLKKQLETQAGKIADEERNNQVRAIEAKQKVLQRSYEDAQAEFQQAQQDISARIYQKMAGVLEKYASSNGFAVVLDVSGQQSAVLWGNQGTVITRELVEAYNAQSPVPPPKAPASGAQAKPSGAAANSPTAQAPAATPKKP
jgi:outer membrane protein